MVESLEASMSTDNRSSEAQPISMVLPSAKTPLSEVSPEMREYLELEAARRKISVAEMYAVECSAKAAIEELGITEEFLDHVMQVARPPQKDRYLYAA